jgi:hypothetical protein
MQDKWIMMGVFIAGVCVCFAVLYAMGFSFRSSGGTKLNPPQSPALRLSTSTSTSFGSMRDNAMLGAQKEQVIQGANGLQGMYQRALNEINTFEQGNPVPASYPAAPPLTNPYTGPASPPPAYPSSPVYNETCISVKPTDMLIPLTRQMLPGAN